MLTTSTDIKSTTTPYITAYQDSKDFWLTGGKARILGETSQTNGAFCLVHLTHQYGESTPLHIHPDHDEAFFVLHGDVKGVCGETEWEASSGRVHLAAAWRSARLPGGQRIAARTPGDDRPGRLRRLRGRSR